MHKFKFLDWNLFNYDWVPGLRAYEKYLWKQRLLSHYRKVEDEARLETNELRKEALGGTSTTGQEHG
jgi:hypothetical protein